jgi:hypothetical protein
VRNSASAGIEPSGCRQLSATASESLPRKDTLLLKSAMPSTILLPSVLVSTEPPAPKPECPPTLPISERHEGRLDASTGELKLTSAFAPQPSLSATRTRLLPADHPLTSIHIHRPSNKRCAVGWVICIHCRRVLPEKKGGVLDSGVLGRRCGAAYLNFLTLCCLRNCLYRWLYEGN